MIVTKSASRFARNTVDSLTAVRYPKDAGGKVMVPHSSFLGYKKGENGRLVIDLVVWEQVQADTDWRQNLSVRNRTLFADRLAEVSDGDEVSDLLEVTTFDTEKL